MSGLFIKTAVSLSIVAAQLSPSIAVAEDPPAAAGDSSDDADKQAQKIVAAIKALKLPSFENKTTLAGDAGKIEALQLATGALMSAAYSINEKTKAKATGQIIILAGDEKVSFAAAQSMQIQLDALTQSLAGLEAQIPKIKKPKAAGRAKSFMALPAAAAAIGEITTALAGLLGSETTVNAIALDELNDKALALAVARFRADTGGGAVLPGELLAPNLAKSKLYGDLGALLTGAARVSIARARLADDSNANAKLVVKNIDTWLTGFAAFYAKVATPDKEGNVALLDAIRAEALQGNGALVLRVKIVKAGGSFITTKNIATTFGADPLRITGGLVASYVLTNPADGSVKAAGVVNCRTGMGRLRQVQEGVFDGKATCAVQ